MISVNVSAANGNQRAGVIYLSWLFRQCLIININNQVKEDNTIFSFVIFIFFNYKESLRLSQVPSRNFMRNRMECFHRSLNFSLFPLLYDVIQKSQQRRISRAQLRSYVIRNHIN